MACFALIESKKRDKVQKTSAEPVSPNMTPKAITLLTVPSVFLQIWIYAHTVCLTYI